MNDAIAFGIIFCLSALAMLGGSIWLIIPAAFVLFSVSPADPWISVSEGRLAYAAVSAFNALVACGGAYLVGFSVSLI